MPIDLTIPCETKSLLRPSQATFYPISIPAQHFQLKHYISTREPNIIYFASINAIYALNTSSRQRRLIKSLPWKPQCLDAGYGWICVGGPENGQCAFINVDEDRSTPMSPQQRTEVDDLLPLDLNPNYRRNAINETYYTPERTRAITRSCPKYELQTHELGGSIVNSVTVQLLHSDQKGIEDDVVAVMTDNDSTVRIFSLKQSRLLQTLNFPTFMNHASISGDGKLLLAVGDDRRAFFYQKNVIPGATDVGAYSFARHEWHEFADVKLPLPDSTDVCFSTAFSPSGHICAVASQKGFITIYNTTLVRDGMDSNEAVIHVLQTSRPCVGQSGCGAIRSMSFSPAPWDLLAWAEDHGRMCVVDLRNAFQSRQTVVLETESPYLLRAEVEDHDYTAEQRQLEIERRLVERHREALEAEDHFAAVNDAADYVEVAAARRRSERESPNVASQTLRDNPQGLTESERQMIDSIGLRRIRENHPEDSDISTTAPVSLSYNNASLGSLSSTNSSNPHSRSTANIHDFMRQRNLERSRGNERSWQPRRPSSVVISNSDTNSAPSDLSSSQHSSLAPVGTAIPPLSTSPSRLQSGSNLTGSPHLMAVDPWDTIINSMSSTNLPGDVMSRFGSLRSRNLDRRMQAQALENSLAIARADPGASRTDRTRGTNARAVRQMRAAVGRADPVYDEIDREVLLRRVHPPRYPRPNEGVVTTGIGWSWDGRSLYVATEEGILAYMLNLEGRKTFPGKSFV